MLKKKPVAAVTTATAVVAVAFAGPALAQQQPPQRSAPAITVIATKLDEARSSILPSLGATRYEFSPRVIEGVPQGDQAPLNQILMRAPGVAQDSFGQVHIRGDHSNVQYRLDGVQLPEGLSLFNQVLATQYANKLALITGALPAHYGFRQAGVIDIQVKSGRTDPGAEAVMTAGTRDWLQPAFSWGASASAFDGFVTGQFLHNNIGIENPERTFTPIHDKTDQWRGLTKLGAIVDEDTRLSLIAGGASARFQLPQVQGARAANTVSGFSALNSALLDQRQWEDTYFAMVALQKRMGPVDFQLSTFGRSSELSYQPDPLGDLMFNGVSPWANRRSVALGVQGDGSWKAAPAHTVRGGFLVQRERATGLTHALALPADDDGEATSDQPTGIAFGYDQIAWQYGVYLQNEWKVSPTVTLNTGVRFDATSGETNENQVSPRVNAVWQPNGILTARAGYARYVTPPPLGQLGNAALLAAAGTTAAPPNTLNDPVKAERAHYFDAGIDLKPIDGLTLGFSAYYKLAQNLLDQGQFGAPIFLTSFNYAEANIKGIELHASYDEGPWSMYGNVAWSQALATQVNSAQYNLEPAELAFISRNYIVADHDQSWSGSAGAAYTFGYGSPWATRVAADLIYGTGLRRTVTDPNDSTSGSYTVINLSVAQKIPVAGTRGGEIRLDVLNAFDAAYQLRDGTGVGVGAPQFGLRRTVLVTLRQKF